jgi:hypothetical protein
MTKELTFESETRGKVLSSRPPLGPYGRTSRFLDAEFHASSRTIVLLGAWGSTVSSSIHGRLYGDYEMGCRLRMRSTKQIEYDEDGFQDLGAHTNRMSESVPRSDGRWMLSAHNRLVIQCAQRERYDGRRKNARTAAIPDGLDQFSGCLWEEGERTHRCDVNFWRI